MPANKYFFMLLAAGLLSSMAFAQERSNPFSLEGDLPAFGRETQESDPAAAPSVEPARPIAPQPESDTGSSAELEPSIPALASPVVDQAGIFTSAQASSLAKKIREVHKLGGPQMQILIVKDLRGFSIEEYSIAAAEAWKLGSVDKGDGVIFLMSVNDRQIRIEVGEGIEGELTDVESHQIIQEQLVPAFSRGQFAQGFEAGIDAVAGQFGIQSSLGGLAPPDKVARVRKGREEMVPFMLPMLIFLVTFPIVARFLGKNSLLKSAIGAAYAGTLTYFFVGHLFFIALAVIFGFLIGVVGPLNFLMAVTAHSGRGGFGGGFGGGGGGWSGGGGGFSGGGASGRW